jgi:ribosomal protein S27AE
MIYHLLHVSTYPEKFLRFLVRNKISFNLDDHHFVIETNDKKLFGHDILSHIHYSVTKKGWGIFGNLRKVRQGDKVLVHYLGNPRHLLLFCLVPRLARQMVWSVWGGDAYFPQMIDKSWKYRFYEVMRRKVIPQIPWITCMVRGDYEAIKSNYDTRAKYIYSVYPSDVNDEAIVRLRETCPEECGNVVLVGNSADPSNNHDQVFTALIPCMDQIDEIVVPLSYGGSKDYISRVIRRGQQLFGEKFIPLTKFLSADEYGKILCKAKVLVLNHARQQGLGNAVLFLALRKKIFIRSDVTSYNYFRGIGIQIHDTVKLMQGEENLFDFDAAKAAKNAEIILNELSERNLVELWNQVFKIRF